MHAVPAQRTINSPLAGAPHVVNNLVSAERRASKFKMTTHHTASAGWGAPTPCDDMYKPRRFWWLTPEAASDMMWATASVLVRFVAALMLIVFCVYWGVFVVAVFAGLASVQWAEDGAFAVVHRVLQGLGRAYAD